MKVQRFIKDRVMKPFRAFLLNDGYEIPFAKALYNFQLGDIELEEQERKKFLKKYDELGQAWLEKKRVEEDERKEEQKKVAKWSQFITDSLSRDTDSHDYLNNKWGHCVLCGQYTNEWWMFDGKTNTCKCYKCR